MTLTNGPGGEGAEKEYSANTDILSQDAAGDNPGRIAALEARNAELLAALEAQADHEAHTQSCIKCDVGYCTTANELEDRAEELRDAAILKARGPL